VDGKEATDLLTAIVIEGHFGTNPLEHVAIEAHCMLVTHIPQSGNETQLVQGSDVDNAEQPTAMISKN
jgi:hypothetical protein